MLHPASQIRQPRGDAVLALSLAVNAPALPAADRGADSSLEPNAAARHVADHIVGEMSTDAAIQKVADANHLVFAVGVNGFSDQARSKAPDLRAAAVALRADGQRAKEAVILIAAGRDGVCGRGVGLSGELHRFGAITIALKSRLT